MRREKIGRLLAKVRRPGKLPASQYLPEGSFPVIDQGASVIAGYHNDPELVFRGPLPITIFGDHTRAVKLSREPFICGADGTQLLYPNDESIDPVYFYYAVQNVDLSNYFYARHLKFLRDHEISIPSLDVQRRILEVIEPIDDLIDNNRRRIALLEQSARLLYREWFVHLRFPGHEHVKVVDGVPEGWATCTAFDAMDVMSGGTPKTDVADYWNGEIPFFTPKDAVDAPYVLDTEKHLTDRGMSSCNSQLYPKNTLFITARGTVGNLNLAQVPMAMNQSCYALRGKDYLSQFYLYCALNEAVMQFKSRAGGAVFDAIVVNTFKLIPFVRPPEALVVEFTELATPMFQQVDRLLFQSTKLRQARDLLLPRLMSGDIAV